MGSGGCSWRCFPDTSTWSLRLFLLAFGLIMGCERYHQGAPRRTVAQQHAMYHNDNDARHRPQFKNNFSCFHFLSSSFVCVVYLWRRVACLAFPPPGAICSLSACPPTSPVYCCFSADKVPSTHASFQPSTSCASPRAICLSALILQHNTDVPAAPSHSLG